jgi:hypothetical protein
MAIAAKAAECAQLCDDWLQSVTGDDTLTQAAENQVFRYNH